MPGCRPVQHRRRTFGQVETAFHLYSERPSKKVDLPDSSADVLACRAAPLEAGGGADPKWRFMARIGPRPAATQYAELNAAPVNPEGAKVVSERRQIQADLSIVQGLLQGPFVAGA